jgi:F0F1-type ATP synthase assembly protein I
MTDEIRSGQGNKSLSGNDFAGAGIQFAVALVLFIFLGSWLDKRFGTGPLFVLLGVVVGGGGSFYSFYRKVVAAQKLDDEERRKRREAGL